jgi:hypothetical protein
MIDIGKIRTRPLCYFWGIRRQLMEMGGDKTSVNDY